MRIISVETTPNPNSIKLNVDQQLGAPKTFTRAERSAGPDFITDLLGISELQSVFVCQDFITINKDPRAGWPGILERATILLSGAPQAELTIEEQRLSAEKEGQVQVFVQTFKGIPIQVKVVDRQGEARISLGSQFNEAAMFVQEVCGSDFLKERCWADHGVRYGELDEIAAQVADEMRGKFDTALLDEIKAQATGSHDLTGKRFRVPQSTLEQWLQDEDWRKRLAAVEELSHSEDSIESLETALQKDPNPQVRRLAAAALGATGNMSAVSSLCNALLSDRTVAVRRTAGDALSDIGDVSAQPSMIQALNDSNKLVRWRAARFLYDLGTDEALPPLEAALNEPEFEVLLEIKAAINRISGGREGLGPMWKRIIQQTNE